MAGSTIIYTPDAINQCEREIESASNTMKTPLQISSYDFKSTITASAKMGEAMFSANAARDVIADFVLKYRDTAEAMKRTCLNTDNELAQLAVKKLSN